MKVHATICCSTCVYTFSRSYASNSSFESPILTSLPALAECEKDCFPMTSFWKLFPLDFEAIRHQCENKSHHSLFIARAENNPVLKEREKIKTNYQSSSAVSCCDPANFRNYSSGVPNPSVYANLGRTCPATSVYN